ncbi:hypothetical protein TcasGA2_TC006473 [Tribolium castaneum]|uniref:Uncharacterized protein n=1 Tax=Tribolium castaneum TaxID=7070 RepID=D6WX28_TRICA|nr:hypothetical protein TcasGA2_TC006473 [Tribolium castaneum]
MSPLSVYRLLWRDSNRCNIICVIDSPRAEFRPERTFVTVKSRAYAPDRFRMPEDGNREAQGDKRSECGIGATALPEDTETCCCRVTAYPCRERAHDTFVRRGGGKTRTLPGSKLGQPTELWTRYLHDLNHIDFLRTVRIKRTVLKASTHQDGQTFQVFRRLAVAFLPKVLSIRNSSSSLHRIDLSIFDHTTRDDS